MNDRDSLEGNERSGHDDPARWRFYAIAAIRLSGAVMVMIGLLGLNNALPIPAIASYALIAVGLVDAFVMPIVLSKRWSTRNQ